jgi:ribonuclease D
MENTDALPAPIWVDRPAPFQAMLERLQGEPSLAVDTESNSFYVYEEQVCLIQISVPGADYLIDPLTLKDLSGLGPLLADPAVLKVLHGADYDLTVLHRDYQFTVSNLFDTMWASRILGWPAHGLAALLQEHFGITVNKKYQRANWGIRPLPPAQIDYARLDTHYLLRLKDLQVKALHEANRWDQAQHRFAQLAQTRSVPREFDPEGFWQMSGARDLDDAGRGVLRELFNFRDHRARLRNRPPFKILSNRALLALSEQRPHTLDGLRKVSGVPSWLVQQSGSHMLAAIERGAQRPHAWEDRPRTHNNHEKNHNARPTRECQARFEALRAWRNAAAEQREVEPDIVLNNHTLWAIAQQNPRTLAQLAENDLLAAWQIDEFGQAVLDVIKNLH